MKNLVYIVFAVTVFASCKSNDGSFTVTGKIKSPPSDMVYLEQLSYESSDVKFLDSAKIGSDGSYKLKGSSTQQNLFIVGFKDNPAVIFVNDASDIKIDFDNNGFHYPEVSGSDATKELYSFIKNYWQKDSVLSITYQQLGAVNDQKSADTNYVRSLQQQYTKELNSLSDVLRSFINNSKNPAGICFVLDKAKGALSPDELTALIQNATNRFPQHTGLAEFKKSLTQQPGSETSSTYALLNQQAPDLTMQSTDGKNISISSFKGKYVLVDFWASWCSPCRQENPNVVAAYNKYKNKNFAILGVSLDDDKAAWIKAISDDHLTWNHMSDLKQWESSAVSAYHFDGIPFNVLIDPQGKIIASSLRGEALEQKLSEVLQ